MPSGGSKKSPCTPSIEQIRSFGISKIIQSIKLLVRLEPSCKQCLNCLTPFRLPLCKFLKLQYIYLPFIAGLYRDTNEGSVPKIAQYSPYRLSLNLVTASEGSCIYILFFHFLLLQLVLFCVAALKVSRTSTIVQVIFFFWSFEISKNIQIIKLLYVYSHLLRLIKGH